MTLFRINNQPIRFNLIDIDEDARILIEELIETQGGESTDDANSIIKFTSKKRFGKNQYPRAKIYDIGFIVQCVRENKIVETEQFRLSAKDPGDEYFIEHFLFGTCLLKNKNNQHTNVSAPGSLTGTHAINNGQDHHAALRLNETMFTTESSPQSLSSIDEHVDESQMVILPPDLVISPPTLAGGDATKTTTGTHEKRPCNLEYELVVQPKMAALEREARKLAAAKESNAESRQLQRSLRTRTRRTHVTKTEALQEENSSSSKNVNPVNDRVRKEQISIISDNSNSPEAMSLVNLRASPEKMVASTPKLSSRGDLGWIETKNPVPTGTVPKVLSDVVISGNRRRKIEKNPVPTGPSKVFNICYKGLTPAAGFSENTKAPVVSKAPKRKHTKEKFSVAATTSKRNGNSDERKGGRDSSDSSELSLNYSSEEEVPQEKRFRKKDLDISSFGEQSNSDDSSREDYPRSQPKIDLTKPGPSGIRKITRDFYIDDDDDDSSSYADSDKTTDSFVHRKASSRTGHHRVKKTRDYEKKSTVPKLEHDSSSIKSRGQVWRSQLVEGSNERSKQAGPFTPSERRIMVDYLLESKCVHRGKGLLIWKEMINDGYMTHRTPQSLQNQFQKHILPNIEHFHELEPAEKQQFLLLRSEKSESSRKR